MAYSPPVIYPTPNPRALVEAQLRRAALVKALRERLTALLAALPGDDHPIPVPQPPVSEHPALPRGLFGAGRPGPVFVPIPPGMFDGPTRPSIPPGLRPSKPDYLPSWPPPSARTWTRMPGFYDEAPVPPATRGRFGMS